MGNLLLELFEKLALLPDRGLMKIYLGAQLLNEVLHARVRSHKLLRIRVPPLHSVIEGADSKVEKSKLILISELV